MVREADPFQRVLVIRHLDPNGKALTLGQKAAPTHLAVSTQEHQARSVERMEPFVAARRMEALLPEHGTAAGMIQ